MFNNSAKIMFFLILMTGTMITVSANSWFAAWMGLEINLLAFIPLMSDNNLMSTEASLKYFLTQALASTVLLFAVIISMMDNKLIFQLHSNTTVHMIILSSLFMKSGTAPFHFWFPNVMSGLTWMNSLVLMTWQKIAPLMLISYIIIKPFLMICIIISVIVGSLGGLNQTSLRKLMAYSSINHLGWMLAALYSSESLWFMYFLMYSFLSFTLIFMFNLLNLSHINQLFNFFMNSKTLKFTMMLNLLSLGGLPPFLGFLPKWLVIQTMTINNQMFLMAVLTIMTLITLFFYLRLCYTAFMFNHYEMNWTKKIFLNSTNMNLYLYMSFLSIFGLFLVSMIYLTL